MRVDFIVVIVYALTGRSGVGYCPIERIGVGMRPVVVIVWADVGVRIVVVDLVVVVVGSNAGM